MYRIFYAGIDIGAKDQGKVLNIANSMSWITLYRLPLMTFLVLVFFLTSLVCNLINTKILVLNGKDVECVEIKSSSSGSYSYSLTFKDRKYKKKYTRDYKSLCISNLLTYVNCSNKGDILYLAIPKGNDMSEGEDQVFYSFSYEKPDVFSRFLNMISFLICNYTFFIIIPIVLIFIICKDEFLSSYCYKNTIHKKFLKISLRMLILILLIFSLY